MLLACSYVLAVLLEHRLVTDRHSNLSKKESQKQLNFQTTISLFNFFCFWTKIASWCGQNVNARDHRQHYATAARQQTGQSVELSCGPNWRLSLSWLRRHAITCVLHDAPLALHSSWYKNRYHASCNRFMWLHGRQSSLCSFYSCFSSEQNVLALQHWTIAVRDHDHLTSILL